MGREKEEKVRERSGMGKKRRRLDWRKEKREKVK